jgi:hypothetical protein
MAGPVPAAYVFRWAQLEDADAGDKRGHDDEGLCKDCPSGVPDVA